LAVLGETANSFELGTHVAKEHGLIFLIFLKGSGPFTHFKPRGNMAYQTIDPATGKLIKTNAGISEKDMEAGVATAYKAFRGDWQYHRQRSVPG
jgi:acyl-CoA reductase-like NAD-dependent aldehyde dehydrogenase